MRYRFFDAEKAFYFLLGYAIRCGCHGQAIMLGAIAPLAGGGGKIWFYLLISGPRLKAVIIPMVAPEWLKNGGKRLYRQPYPCWLAHAAKRPSGDRKSITAGALHSPYGYAPNLLAQQFTATAPNAKQVVDLSYTLTLRGWLYLAVVMDLYSRRIIDWYMGDRMKQYIALNVVRMVSALRQPKPGLVHHSDLGRSSVMRYKPIVATTD